MTDVDLAKRFEGYAKEISKAMETLKALSQMVLRENQIKQDLPVLESKISGLHKQKADLENKVKESEIEFQESTKNREDNLIRRENESLDKMKTLEILLAQNSVKSKELEGARQDMLKSKTYYDERAKEYEDKLNELRERQSRIAEALKA